MAENFCPGNLGIEGFHPIPEKEDKHNAWLTAFQYPKRAYSSSLKADFWWGEAQPAEKYLLLPSRGCQCREGGLDSVGSWLS